VPTRPAGGVSAPPAPVPPGAGPALGLTEDNAQLLWSPDGPRRSGGARFALAREELTALHPTYVRLLVDWAALQPDPARPPQLEAPVSGCARGVGPCAAYAGMREQLAAIASQQRAAAAGAGFQVVLDFFSTPRWAARALSGCQSARASSTSQAPARGALAAYRALIRSLLALAAREGVALDWWSPWNEPNDPVFLNPQRASCAAGAQPLAPAAYAQLARAMAAELSASPGQHHLLLGELNAFPRGSEDRMSIAEFVAALPPDVICLSDVWAVHAYAGQGPGATADPVATLEAALDARGGCARGARVWVTETGAGASHPGSPRRALATEEQAGCRALAAQLIRWDRDPRVGALFQYTFREDPAYPVGLVGPELSHVYPAYRLWLAWSRRKAAGESPPGPAAGCA
jgi:hypothetical protein